MGLLKQTKKGELKKKHNIKAVMSQVIGKAYINLSI